MNTSAPGFTRTLAAWLALLALVLQLAALPLANGHMLQRAIDRAGVHTITICTPSGSHELQVNADGQPVAKQQSGSVAHCALCFVAASSPLLLGPLASVVMSLLACCAKPEQTASVLPAGAGTFWPWSNGPPA